MGATGTVPLVSFGLTARLGSPSLCEMEPLHRDDYLGS
jgi:hypothetical protein